MKDADRQLPKQDEEEWLDVVDGNDQVIGRRLRSAVDHEHASNHRAINALVRNSKGQIWIPTRTPDKHLDPNTLDFSVGGHVSSGESYDATFQRETAEELNIDTSQTPYQFLGKLTPPRDGVGVFMHVYEIYSDETPKYNPVDFSSGSWMYPHELQRRIDQGQPARSDIPIVLKRFYLNRPQEKRRI